MSARAYLKHAPVGLPCGEADRIADMIAEEDHLRDCTEPGSSPLCEDYDCA